MKNRTSFYIVSGLIFLAIIGVITRFISNPTDFLQSIFIFIAVGVIIYFLVRRFYKAGPQKKEHQAFRKAAKRSKKRFLQKDTIKTPTRIGSLTKLKKQTKKDTSHLTVIEGKKGKKKNRASF